MGIVHREPGNGGAEGGSQFHALEDEGHSELVLALQASQVGTEVVFLADPFFGPLPRDVAFRSQGFHPAVVIVVQTSWLRVLTWWRSPNKGTRFSGRVSQGR